MKYKILFSIFTILTLNFLANLAGEKKVMAATCKKIYKTEVIRRLINNDSNKNPVLTENDIRHLPIPIQNYIHYAGAVGRPKIGNMRMTFVGDFKIDIKKDWMKIKTEQYDFFSNPTRLFYIHGSMMFIPMSGWDFYTEGKGNMHVTIASLITVADIKGQEADIGELVTLFNDMCLVAPATLIDERIEWEPIDALSVKGTFSDFGNKVAAILYFNEKGELTNFVTEDKYYSPIGQAPKKVKWSTPVRKYKEINGIKVPAEGDAIWHLEEGDFCYARFILTDIEYNCNSFK